MNKRQTTGRLTSAADNIECRLTSFSTFSPSCVSKPSLGNRNPVNGRSEFQVEKLEDRVLLATGPQLISVQPNEGDVVQDGLVANIAPSELKLIFDDGQAIDGSTLDAIRITRTGFDGLFNGVYDEIIQPGYLDVNPDRSNEVIVRFAETLPDDVYKVEVFAIDSDSLDTTALRNTAGDALMTSVPNSDRETVNFELDLGAQVVAVVPQPIERAEDGSLSQRRDQIIVYFNDDDLDQVAAENPDFYRLIFTSDTVSNTDDATFMPTSVTYDPVGDRTILTFANVIEELGGTGSYRLRIGTDESLPLAPQVHAPQLSLVSDLATGSVNVRFAASSSVRIEIQEQAESDAGLPLIVHEDNVVRLFLNSDPGNESTAQEMVDAINASAELTGILTATIVSGNANEVLHPRAVGLTLRPQATDPGSAFATAADLEELSDVGLIIAEEIQTQFYPFTLPGANTDPGHRPINDLPDFGFDQDAGIVTIPYNFQRDYGVDPFGRQLFNLITDVQMQRAREAFELWSHYLGIQFVETSSSATDDPFAISVVTGDPRAVPAGSTVILDASVAWNDAFGVSDDVQQTRSWFNEAMKGIGRVLGLENVPDLPLFEIMGTINGVTQDQVVDPIYPGNQDIVHGRHLFRNEGRDIDIYRFELTETGRFTAETFAERSENSSLLDTVLTLYVEHDDGNREMISRNDDYFSEDSLVDLELGPGSYYIAVSASGNTNFDPVTENTGFGGTTEGPYDLRLNFRPTATRTIRDATGILLDGDADGLPGGAHNFWFRAVDVANTVYVDKAALVGGDGTIESPYNNLPDALGDSGLGFGDVMRIVGNGGDDGDILTNDDNMAYEIGFDVSQAIPTPLSDGTSFSIPGGVTVMVDAGAIFKLRDAMISAGSSSAEITRNAGALQVLGVPRDFDQFGQVARDVENQIIPGSVFFTSFDDEQIGLDTNDIPTTPDPGDWGGLVFRNDLDRAAGNFEWEQLGIFLNYINHADIRYGGGVLRIDSVTTSIAPIHVTDGRPTISFNTISNSAGSAISANPDSFEESNFHTPEYQETVFTSDYERIGPKIQGNRLVDNSVNGMFIRIPTQAGNELGRLTVSGRWDDTDVVHVVAENLVIDSTPGGPTGGAAEGLGPGVGRGVNPYLNKDARLDSRLAIDPGIIVKLDSARIETALNAQLIAEGTQGRGIVFTSLADDAFGAGGTFDTTNDDAESVPLPGDWGGIYLGLISQGSIDHSLFRYAGGINRIEGNFAGFNTIEIHQADARIAHSTFQYNADGTGGDVGANRFGRGPNAPGTVYVVGSAPFIVNNVFRANGGPIANFAANSMDSMYRTEIGRSTGRIEFAVDDDGFLLRPDNQGPLVAGNRLTGNQINGIEVRGGTLTTESVWDDTDIVHVLRDTIVVPNFHAFGGLRLESSADESLVVKLRSQDPGGNDSNLPDRGGFTASGSPSDISDRIGGRLHVIGQPDRPVVLTSFSDDSVGAGIDPEGRPQNDTNGDGLSMPATPGEGDLTLLPGAGPLTVNSVSSNGNLLRDSLVGEGITTIGNAVFTGSDVSAGLFAGGYPSIGLDSGIVLSTGDVNFSVGPNTDAGSSGAASGTGDADLDNGFGVITEDTTSLQFDFESAGGDLFFNFVFASEEYNEFANSAFNDVFAFFVDGENIALVPGTTMPISVNTINGGNPLGTNPQNNQFFTNNSITDGGLFTNEVGFDGFTTVLTATKLDLGPGTHTIKLAISDVGDSILDAAVFIEAGSFSDEQVGDVVSGDWQGIILDELSHDRNVDVVIERESASLGIGDINGTPATAQFLGLLAAAEKSGDDNLRLGYQVYGSLNVDDDVDVYSFDGSQGTEVWFDIDRTSQGLDLVLELVDAGGNVIARSDDSNSEQEAAEAVFRVVARIDANPMAKSSFNKGDFYGYNEKDPGMRVVLPGAPGSVNTYHVRLRSSSRELQADLPDLSQITNGLTSGTYELQIRLDEEQEFPGSTVQYADIRFATNGIEVIGQVLHSPLSGETTEAFGVGGGEINDLVTSAQPIGNPWQSDRAAISLAGNLVGPLDVDWYEFEVQNLAPASTRLPIVIDVDYADGFARPDIALAVFEFLEEAPNSPQWRLVAHAESSNVSTDQPSPERGADVDDLSRGSNGLLDAFLGTLELETGRYALAVSSGLNVPEILADDELLRREPIDAFARIVEDHIDAPGIFSTAEEPLVPTFVTDQNAVPFHLGDVSLFISTDSGFEETTLHVVDPFTGTREFTAGTFGSHVGDVALHEEGMFYSLSVVDPGNFEPTLFTDQFEGHVLQIDPRDASFTDLGDDGIRTFVELFDEETGLPTEEGDGDFAPVPFPDGEALGAGVRFAATTFGSYVPALANLGFFAVGNRGDAKAADAPGVVRRENLLYQFDLSLALTDNDEPIALSAPSEDRDPGGLFAAGAPDIGAATSTVERGQLFTAPTILGINATRWDPEGMVPVFDVRDRDTIRVDTEFGETVLEFDVFDFMINLEEGSPQVDEKLKFTRDGVETTLTFTDNDGSDPEDPAPPGAVLIGDLPTMLESFKVALPDGFSAGFRLFNGATAGRLSISGGDPGTRVRGAVTGWIPTGRFGVSPGNVPVQVFADNLPMKVAGNIRNALRAANIADAGVKIAGSGNMIELIGAKGVRASGSLGAFTGGRGPGGDVTGIAILGSSMYAVSDAGGLYSVGGFWATAASAHYVDSSFNDLAGISFSGLAAGPENVERGRYRDMLFAVDTSGRLYAFNTEGELQPIFANGASSISTGSGGANGLAFSTLDENLWHIVSGDATVEPADWMDVRLGFSNQPQEAGGTVLVETRGRDEGHGILQPQPGVRITAPGAASLHFGRGNSDQRVLDADGNLITRALGRSFDFPGGAHGSVISNEFSLAEYRASDRPVLYFNYFLETEQNVDGVSTVGVDTFRVYVGGDDGAWNLVGTNNLVQAEFTLDETFDPTNVFFMQEMFDNSFSSLPADGGDVTELRQITTLGDITGGNGYADGNYVGVGLTGGLGNGAMADIVVEDGMVISVTITGPGNDYAIDDILSADDTNVGGGGGTGFEVLVGNVGNATDTSSQSFAGWRQARIDLSPFAGRDNLRLRYDFATGGSQDVGNVNTTGQELHAVHASQIADGDEVLVGGHAFEFELGFSLTTTAGALIEDGETFTVSNEDGLEVTFEFERDGVVPTDGRIPIPIFDAQTSVQIAEFIVEAINANGLADTLPIIVPAVATDETDLDSAEVNISGARTLTTTGDALIVSGSFGCSDSSELLCSDGSRSLVPLPPARGNYLNRDQVAAILDGVMESVFHPQTLILFDGQSTTVTDEPVSDGDVFTFSDGENDVTFEFDTGHILRLPSSGTMVTGEILSFVEDSIVGGAGYGNGLYRDVALNGGTGRGAEANVFVLGKEVFFLTLTDPGVGYTTGDILSADSSDIGNGAGFAVEVAAFDNYGLGETITVANGTGSFTLELTDNGVAAGNIAVAINDELSQLEVAQAILTAVDEADGRGSQGVNFDQPPLPVLVNEGLIQLGSTAELIELQDSSDVTLSINESGFITSAGTPGVGAGNVSVPFSPSATYTAADMAQILAEKINASLNVTLEPSATVPGRLVVTSGQLELVDDGGLPFDFEAASDIIKTDGSLIRIIKQQIGDPGPLGAAEELPGDQNGSYNLNVRGQRNVHEGIYIDDIIVGFAERGELVTGITVSAPSTDFTRRDTDLRAGQADFLVPKENITEGLYQVELRPGADYIFGGPLPFRSFDTNDRLAQRLSLEVPSAADLSQGQILTLSNGLDTVEFQFFFSQPVENPDSNDTLAMATEVGFTAGEASRLQLRGQTVGDNPELAPADDVDLYRVLVSAGELLTVDIDDADFDSIVRIFDQNGVEIARSDNDPAPGELPSEEPYIEIHVPTAGAVYVGVSSSSNDSYNIQVAGSGTGDSNGTYDIDVATGAGNVYQLNVPVASDATNFEVARLIVDTINWSEVRANGSNIRVSDHLDITASHRDGVFLNADDSVSNVINIVGDVSLSGFTTTVAASETVARTNDTIPTAVETGLAPGKPGRFTGTGVIGDNPRLAEIHDIDVDFFRVPLFESDPIRIDVNAFEVFNPESPKSRLLSLVRLYDAEGNVVVSSSSSVEEPSDPPVLNYIAESTGDFFVAVSTLDNLDYDPFVEGAGFTLGQVDGFYELLIDVGGGAIPSVKFDEIGDDNRFRDQGQIVLKSNRITDSLAFGISAGNGVRVATDGQSPHPGSTRLLREVNTANLVPGISISNNVIAGSGAGAIRFAGDTNPDNEPVASVLFGRIVNNTLYGLSGVADVGILVNQNASPTILNNVVANFSSGIDVAFDSASTVVGGNVYQNNGVDSNVGAEQFPISLLPDDPLFVNASERNFYLDVESLAIDSSIDSVEDRFESVTVKEPLEISASPILAPSRDIFGQLRGDDPDVETPPGVGENLFKDRGAIDRVDFRGPVAFIAAPLDNDNEGIDLNPAVDAIRLQDATLARFVIDLEDLGETGLPGIGVDDVSVTGDSVLLYRDGERLRLNVDYRFDYNETSDQIILTPQAGIWLPGFVYTIEIVNEDSFVAQAPSGPEIGDGQSFFITDNFSHTRLFEFDSGFRIQVPTPLQLIVPTEAAGLNGIVDGETFTIYLGGQAAFEFDDNGVSGSGTIRIPFQETDSVNDLAEAITAAITESNLSLLPTNLGDGIVHVGGPVETVVNASSTKLSLAGQAGTVTDGDLFSLTVGLFATTFEFDNDDNVLSGSTALLFASTDTASETADDIATAITAAGLGVDAENLGNGIVQVGGSSDTSLDTSLAGITQSGSPGVAVGSNVINFIPSESNTAEMVAQLMADAIEESSLQAVTAFVDGSQVLIQGATTFSGITSSFAGAIRDKANNTTPPNEDVAPFKTRFTIDLPASMDFGDAPESYAILLQDDGARHVMIDTMFLGTEHGSELDGKPDALANADTGDDGVFFGSALSPGANVPVSVLASVNGFLDAWIDFDRDGQWDVANERIFESQPLVAGTNLLTFNVPESAAEGGSYARFRYSSAGRLLPSGRADNGEVEDYLVEIVLIPPPSALPDVYDANEDMPLVVSSEDGVLSNDTDPQGDSLEAVLINSTMNGSLTFVADGSFQYVPQDDFNGQDAFSYRATDGGLSSQIVIATINVEAVPDVPRANDDGAITDEDRAVTISVLTNDSDNDGQLMANSIVIVSAPRNGQVAILPDGQIVYTPAKNFFGEDAFTYTVRDDDGAASLPALVTVVVNDVNDAPEAVNDSDETRDATPVTINLLQNDTDVDGTVVASTVSVNPLPKGGTLVNNGDGTVTYTPVSGFAGTDTFRYTVRDDDDAISNEATVTIAVEGVNAAPVAANDSRITNQRVPVTIDVAANDSDLDGIVIPASVAITSTPANGTVVNNVDGTITYTPNSGYTGYDSFTYAIQDDDGMTSNTATVTVQVSSLPPPWQNPDNHLDVFPDGVIAPIDALLIINEINSGGSRALPVPPVATFLPPPFLDPSGDNVLSPIDALLVINFLNAQSEAESEAATISVSVMSQGEDSVGSTGSVASKSNIEARVVPDITEPMFVNLHTLVSRSDASSIVPLPLSGPTREKVESVDVVLAEPPPSFSAVSRNFETQETAFQEELDEDMLRVLASDQN